MADDLVTRLTNKGAPMGSINGAINAYGKPGETEAIPKAIAETFLEKITLTDKPTDPLNRETKSLLNTSNALSSLVKPFPDTNHIHSSGCVFHT